MHKTNVHVEVLVIVFANQLIVTHTKEKEKKTTDRHLSIMINL